MNALWLFNPDNDVALAADTQQFTPPAAALKLRRSGAALPFWMARPEDYVLIQGISDDWLSDVQKKFGPIAEPWDYITPAAPRPWGWSRAVAYDFRQSGVDDLLLPSDMWLRNFRDMSGRATAADIHRQISAKLDFPVWPAAIVAKDVSTLREALSLWPDAVIKTPWSSSGRGVQFVSEANRNNALKVASAEIARYGYVTVEKRADKICDFAMLFFSDVDGARYQGLSYFEADKRGHYKSNLVTSQDAIKAKIGARYPAGQLQEVKSALEAALGELCSGVYRGPVGVDMLLSESPEGALLHPVVEINFRYTMGFLALALAEKVRGEASFYIEQGDTTACCNPIVEGCKLISGKLALTPPGGDFTFILEKR